MLMLSRLLAAFFVFMSVGGAIATVGFVPTYELQYFVGFAVIGLLLAVTALSLRGPIVQNIAALLALVIIFSSYFVKLLLIVVDPASPVTLGMLPRIGINNPDEPALWMKALGLVAYGVAPFCIVVTLLSKFEKQPPVYKTESFMPEVTGLGFWWVAWLTLLLLSIVTAGLSYKYDIGLMGSTVKTELPFHLRGIVFYSRSYVLTGSLLLLAFIAKQQKSPSRFWWAIGLLVVNGLADALIRSSRSAILLPFLYTFFLMVVSGIPIRKRFVLYSVLIGVLLLLSLPYLNILRAYRSAGNELWDALILTVANTPFAPIDFLKRYVVWIVYRLPGIEMLIAIFGHSPLPEVGSWVDILTRPNGVAGYLTNDVLFTPPHHPHLAAPSYFGWWYLTSGTVGVVLGGVFLAVVVRLVWKHILCIHIASSVVIRVFFLMFLFTATTEGTLDMLPKTVLAMAVTIVLIEAGVRVACRYCKTPPDANE